MCLLQVNYAIDISKSKYSQIRGLIGANDGNVEVQAFEDPNTKVRLHHSCVTKHVYIALLMSVFDLNMGSDWTPYYVTEWTVQWTMNMCADAAIQQIHFQSQKHARINNFLVKFDDIMRNSISRFTSYRIINFQNACCYCHQ